MARLLKTSTVLRLTHKAMEEMIASLRSKVTCEVVVCSTRAGKTGSHSSIEVSTQTLERAMGCAELEVTLKKKVTPSRPLEYFYLTLACQGYQLTDARLALDGGRVVAQVWDCLCTARALHSGSVREVLSWCINGRDLEGYYSANGGPASPDESSDYLSYAMILERSIGTAFLHVGNALPLRRPGPLTLSIIGVDNNATAAVITSLTGKARPPPRCAQTEENASLESS